MLFVPTLLCTVCLCCPRQPTSQVGCAEAHASLAKLVAGAGDAAAAESHWSSSIAAYEAALQHPAQVGRGVMKDAGGRGVGGEFGRRGQCCRVAALQHLAQVERVYG